MSSTSIIFDFDSLFEKTQQLAGIEPTKEKTSDEDHPMRMGSAGKLVFSCMVCQNTRFDKNGDYCTGCTEMRDGNRKIKHGFL